MAINEILPFCPNDTGTNLLTQPEYSVDAERTDGNTGGTVARSKLVNKAARQGATMASGLGQFTADNQTLDITDGLTPTQVADRIKTAVENVSISVAQDQNLYINNAVFDGAVLERDIVAWNSAGNDFVQAIGDNTLADLVVGVADKANSRVLILGNIGGPWLDNLGLPMALIPGQVYYMANTNRPGHITPTPSNPDILSSVGVAKDTNTLFFKPEVLNSARSVLWTSSNSFIVQYNVKQILVSAASGGGGGGGAGGADGDGGPNAASGGGAGGEAGNFVFKQRIIVNHGDSVSATVGAGGAIGVGGAPNVAGTVGGQGGQTTIFVNAAPVITIIGGLGGNGSGGVNPASQYSGGAPPAGASGGFGATGSGSGTVDPTFSGRGGDGGSGIYGSGASGGRGDVSNQPAVSGISANITKGYGGGGGGGGGKAATNSGESGNGGNGGTGAPGFVLLEY